MFVVYDAWIQSETAGPEVNKTIYTKAVWSFSRSVSAMLVTSATTFFAFISTAMSIVPTIAAFGIFSSTMIFFCLMFTVTWFFASLMYYVQHMQYNCCSKKSQYPAWHPKYQAPTTHEMTEIRSDNSSTADIESHASVFDVTKLHTIELFYYNKLSHWVFKYRRYILALSLVLLIVFAYQTSLVEKGTADPDAFPSMFCNIE